jgi:uncharacterized membrane protein YgdD (TMEM256/DUF423 family)
MKSIRLVYLVGVLFGISGVIAGAMGAHALRDQLTESQLKSFETAVRFQMYHALLLLLIGLLLERFSHPRGFWAAGFVAVGTLLFSGSIYLLVLTPLKPGFVTPIGGLLLIIGWAVMGVWLWKRKGI